MRLTNAFWIWFCIVNLTACICEFVCRVTHWRFIHVCLGGLWKTEWDIDTWKKRQNTQASYTFIHIDRETAHEQLSLVVQFVFSLLLCFLPNSRYISICARDKDKDKGKKCEREGERERKSSIWHIKNKTFCISFCCCCMNCAKTVFESI